jgi:hypothetical protein
MTRILQRQIGKDYPVAVGGDGPYVIDRDGRRYLDASGGAAVSCLGHSRRDVVAAIKAQLDALPYAHTAFFTNEPSEALAEHLTARAPDGLDYVYFISGGSEANETALKLARQYMVETGQPQRVNFIARRQSYHGNTLGALAVASNPKRRVMFDGILAKNVSHVAPCYAYRGQRADETEEAYGARVADEVEQAILAAGPETVCAFICEPVVGATMGAVPAVAGYLKRVREICDRHGVLMILDEVMCGMGRTGTLYACEQDGVSPDLLTCAKGLGAGYQPIGATLLSKRIFEAIRDGHGFFQHGFTYIGHPTACAGALAVQQAIEKEDLLSNVRAQGEALHADLAARFADNPHIGDLRGRGLFRGIELVADPETRAPFDPGLKLNARIKQAAMDRGLICYPGGGTIDGWRGDHVLLAPPFILDEAQRAELVEKLGAAVDAALAEVGAGRP